MSNTERVEHEGAVSFLAQVRRRIAKRHVLLLPALVVLAAAQQYVMSQAGLFTAGNVATASVAALLLCLPLCLLPSTRSTFAGRLHAHGRGEALDALRTGLLGIAVPVILLTWSREVLTQNAFGLAAIVTAVTAAGVTCRRDKGRAVLLATGLAVIGTLLLIGGRMHSMNFTPARSLYLGLVSGGVTDLRRSLPALLGVVTAGFLLLLLHTKAAGSHRHTAGSIPFVLLPVALGSTAYAMVTGTEGISPWYVLGGVSALLQLVLLQRIARLAGPTTSAVTALVSFLPFTIVHARMQDMIITSSMKVGAGLVILAGIVLRRILKQVNPGTAPEKADR